MTHELDDMEQKLRDLWEVSKPKSALADEDAAVAVKLLGKEGARRLAATKRGGRYRYRPECIQRIDYYFVPPADGMPDFMAGWRVEATQNGQRRTLGSLLSHERCGTVVRELQKRGYMVNLAVTDAMARYGVTALPAAALQHRPFSIPRQERSSRFAIMDRLKGFAV